ncbi:MAG TPA: alpha/beta hydrolase, partial [Streptosporangiaceae bacterium]|nr:alpha/beta hydrolase [Streptosporangiaceae bacterium]
MPTRRFTFSSADGRQITAYRWDAAWQPTAAVQITHGMGEHARRYEHVAQALTDAGYVVYAQDHRGSDPVNGGLALLHPLADRLRDAGLTDVTVVTYPGARHEILNETNSAEV